MIISLASAGVPEHAGDVRERVVAVRLKRAVLDGTLEREREEGEQERDGEDARDDRPPGIHTGVLGLLVQEDRGVPAAVHIDGDEARVHEPGDAAERAHENQLQSNATECEPPPKIPIRPRIPTIVMATYSMRMSRPWKRDVARIPT